MGVCRTWTLPHSLFRPAAPAPISEIFAGPQGRLYYLRGIDTLGLLETTAPGVGPNVSSNKMTEWYIPATLHSAVGANRSPAMGVPNALALRGASEVWFAMRNGGALVSCETRTNRMTSFHNSYSIPGVPAPQLYPFSHVTALQFRTRDELWFCGTGFVSPTLGAKRRKNELGPFIGRFNVKTTVTMLWQIKVAAGRANLGLNFGLLGPNSVWVDPAGEYAWCTLSNTQSAAFGKDPQPFLWRLHVQSGNSYFWYDTAPPSPFGLSGANKLVPDNPAKPRTLWVSRYGGVNEDLTAVAIGSSTPSFNVYPLPGIPGHADLTMYKNLRFGTLQPQIQEALGAAGCGSKVIYEPISFNVPPDKYEVRKTSVSKEPFVSLVAGTAHPTITAKEKCFATIPLPVTNAGLLTAAEQDNGDTALAFGEASGSVLGVLDP